MSEPTEQDEPTEPGVADVPEPDQEPDEDDAEREAEQERQRETEPEPPPDEQAAQQAEWEARFTKSERAFNTYLKKVTEIYADDAIHLSPFSISPSAPPGFVYGPDAGRVPDEIQRATFEFFGLAREQDYEPDPETRECGTCKGKGKTMTGSHVAGKETRSCPTCHGSGAQGLTASPVAPQGNGTSDEPFTLAELSPSDVPDADNWGEPRILPDGRENPNYGRQPQYKVLVEPWGVTAQLTVQDSAV